MLTRLTLALVAAFVVAVGVFYLAIGYYATTEAWAELELIMLKGDNIPIAFMLFIVCFYIGWGLREALRNDRLIAQGRRDQVLKDMQR